MLIEMRLLEKGLGHLVEVFLLRKQGPDFFPFTRALANASVRVEAKKSPATVGKPAHEKTTTLPVLLKRRESGQAPTVQIEKL